MAFKIKSKYNKRELKAFQEEHKKKFPTYFETLKEGEKIAFGLPKYEHTIGKVVSYKGRYMLIKEVHKDGVVLEPLEVKNGSFLDKPLPRPIFVKEKNYRHLVHIRPAYTM